jgi:hypothetical protein
MMHVDVARLYAPIYLGRLETAHNANCSVMFNTGSAISRIALIAIDLHSPGESIFIDRIYSDFAGA